MNMTEILQQISAVLEENGIPYNLDPRIKNYSGNYYGIFKDKKHLYVTHYFEKDFIAVLTPRHITPEKIKATYGIECEGDPKNTTSYTGNYYGIKITLRKGLLNGQYSIADKKKFFIEITKKR